MRKIYFPLKGLSAFLLTAMLAIVSNNLKAQFVTYPVASEAITRGLDSTVLSVQIAFPACTGVSVTINLGATNSPGVIEYIPGSITKISGTGTITESNISDLQNPVFAVGNTTLGQTLRFTIRRRAFCGSASSSKDNIVVTGTGTGCNFSETNANVNTYTLLAPAFTITPPPALVNTEVGNSYNRTINIVNGGNGCADTVGFWIKYPAASMLLNTLTIGGNPVTALFSNGDSSYYLLSGAQLGADNKLCNGETVTLIENVTVLKCNVVTIYGVAGFDFAGNRCQARTGVSGMSMNNATPAVTVTSNTPLLTGCFVSAPRATRYVIRNNGAGPATNIVINTGSHFNNLTTTDSYGYIDTASMQITLQGQAAFHPDNSYYTGTTLNVLSVINNLACNAGKINNAQLTLPASVILGSGDSIVVTYNFIYCPSTNSCTDAYSGSSQGSQVSYKNACANTTYSTGNYVGSSSLPINLPSLTSFEFPAQVRAGDCYDVTLSTPSGLVSNPAGLGYIEYSLSIPAGVTFSSANLIGVVASPHAGYPRIVGNTVVTRYPVSTGGNPVKFIFCSPLGLCNTVNLDAVITTSPDSSCEISNPANINSVKRCATAPISFVCTGPCAAGGTVPVYWDYSRKNYGEPDNNYNKMPDGSGSLNPGVIYENRYRPGDTLHSDYRAYIVAQTTPASVTAFPHINSNWSFSKHIWAPAGTATVTIVRSGNRTTVTGVPIATTTYGKIFNTDFSQAPAALTSLAPFLVDDSVIVEADFILKDSMLSSSPSSPNMTAVDDGTRGLTFADAPDIVLLTNSVHASTIANPVLTTDKFTCFIPQYNANVLHLFHLSLLYGNNLIGCAGARHEIRGYTRKLSGYSANYFPGEYRPEFMPDSLELIFPIGMSVIPGSQFVAGIFDNTPPTATVVSNASIQPYVAITGSAITGTKVVFDVKSALAANPGWRIQSEGTNYNFGMDARGSCATPNAFTIAGRQAGHVFHWPSALLERTYSDSARSQVSSAYSLLNKPNVNLSSPDATATPASDTASWQLLLQNSSGQAAPLNFIRLVPNASFTNIVVSVNNTPLTANANGLYELSNIAGGATTTVTVSANTNSCALDSIKIESGWDCAAYPSGADLAAYSCWKQLWLKADPLPSQIQLSVDRQPQSPSITLCTTDTMIFKINSALANYADNPVFRVIVPEGLVIASGEIEYPDGSGNWETVNPFIDNGVYVFDIEEHTGVSSVGLPGTVSNPGTANRAARLRLAYSTTCDFVSGTKVSVQQRADRPCGSPVSTDLGFNGIIRANPINIDGAAGAGIVGFNIGLSPASINCGTTTLSGDITPSGEATSIADTIVVSLPAGIVYANNFLSNGGITVVSGYPVDGPGGTQILKLKVPDGITSGNTIGYSFDVAAAYVNFGCGRLNISSQLERTVAPLLCNGLACPNGSKYIVGSGENEVEITKPDLNITGFEYVSGSFAEGGAAVMSVTVANNSLLDAAAGAYYVEFFCGSSTVPFTSVLFPSAITAGNSVTENLAINIPVAPDCNNGESMVVKIRPLTAASQNQCLCNETTRGILNVLPVSLSSFTATQSGCKINLHWRSEAELNFKKYDIEFSNNGRNYATLGSVNGRGSSNTYSYAHQPAQGRVYYRLKIVDNNGTSRYSDIITLNFACNGKNVLLYPNPASSLLNVNLSGFAAAANGKLYNSTGQLVTSQQLVNGTNTLSVDKLATGTYALVVTDAAGERQVYKVQVSRR